MLRTMARTNLFFISALPSSSEQQCHDRHKRHGYAGKPREELPLGYRQVAYQAAGLAVHGEEIILPVPLGAEHPDEHEGIAHFAAADADILVLLNAGGIAHDALGHEADSGVDSALIGAL